MLQQYAVSETYRVGIAGELHAMLSTQHAPKHEQQAPQGDHEAAIKRLSQQTGMPLEQVRETYFANLKRLASR